MTTWFRDDERQLLIRGDCFKHGFLVLVALVLILEFSSQLTSVRLFEEESGAVVSVVLATVVVGSEMLARNYYNFDVPLFRYLWVFFAVIGVVLIVLPAAHLIGGANPTSDGAILSKDWATLVMGVAWLVWGGIGIVKVWADRKGPQEAV